MAICYARLEYVKRSSGKNAVAKSAYNGKLKQQFNGNSVAEPKMYDWSRRSEKPISHSLLLPEHISSDYRTTESLWNSVEQFEKRKDSQVGKEVVIALPDDKIISDGMRIDMAHRFAKKYFVSKGYGVQVDVHHPSHQQSYSEENQELEKNDKNIHAHLLITERPFTEDGKTFTKKKANDLNPEVRGSFHSAYGGIEWSKLWTQFQNDYFEEKGLDLRVDQKGVVSQIHLGPLRMRGKNAHKILEIHDQKIEEAKIQSLEPDVILKKLTETKSIFTSADLERFLQKHLSQPDIEKTRATFWQSPHLVQLYNKESFQPTDKFSSVEVMEEERKILRLSDRIQQKSSFPAPKTGTLSQLNSEQKNAFQKIISGKSLSCIEGLAGTGKSYLLVALKNHYEENGYTVRAFGPDNATAKVLRDKGFDNASNLHYFLYKNHFSKKNQIRSGKEVWIVDESSKMGNRPLLELLKSAEKNNVQLIFSGNSAQLTSVERGGIFSAFCSRYGHVYLEDIQRQAKSVDRDISKRLATGDIASAIRMVSETGGFKWSATKEAALIKTVEKWADDRLHFPYSTSLILAQTNNEVRQLNDLAHTVRVVRNEVSDKEFECTTIFGKIRVSEGDLLEFRMNSKELKVSNGDKGTLIKASTDQFVVALGDRKVSFDPKSFTSFQLGYATTNFRSQGETYDRVYLVYGRQMNQKLFYVGMSRHVRSAECFVSRSEATCLMDLKRQIARKSGVENTLEYTSLEEIDKSHKENERTGKIKELCDSDSLLAKTKGYGYKAFDSIKSGLGSFVERIGDRKADHDFFQQGKEQDQTKKGAVVEIKEAALSIAPKQSSAINDQNPEPKKESQKSILFQSLSKDIKPFYYNYFSKSDNAAVLYAIVQSEAASSSFQKEGCPSYGEWQQACKERNESAFALIRSGGKQLRSVVGEKGFDILQERAQRYEQSLQPKENLETQLTENIEHLLYRLFPEGPQRRDSKGFRFGTKGSLAVVCSGERKGSYYDHEAGEGGGLLKLIQKREGLNSDDAKSWAKNLLSIPDRVPAPTHFSTARFSKQREESWISMKPPSNESVPSLHALSPYLEKNYRLAALYPYKDVSGQLLFCTARLESKTDGKKIVLPLSYGKSHPEANPAWQFKAYAERNRILYNSQAITQSPEKPILIVEGEKTADAAQKLLEKEYVVVSWTGGASAAKDANWSLLQGKNIVIWPDNDQAGFKAAADIESALRKVGVKSLKTVHSDFLKELPQKWDLADSLPEGKSQKFIQEALIRSESKAISMDRIQIDAARHGVSFQQLNDLVCDMDRRIRPDLEKQYGVKVKEMESLILAEAVKELRSEGKSKSMPKEYRFEQTDQKVYSRKSQKQLDTPDL